MIEAPHGTRRRYQQGCHCLPCRAANAQYWSERAAQQQQGTWRGLVPADKARSYLLELQTAGMGYRRVAGLSGLSRNLILGIRDGRKPLIRASTEVRILAVTIAPALGTRVPATPTWRIIQVLLRERFTRAELARRLGKRTGKLQLATVKRVHHATCRQRRETDEPCACPPGWPARELARKVVTLRSELKVRRLHRLVAGEQSTDPETHAHLRRSDDEESEAS